MCRTQLSCGSFLPGLCRLRGASGPLSNQQGAVSQRVSVLPGHGAFGSQRRPLAPPPAGPAVTAAAPPLGHRQAVPETPTPTSCLKPTVGLSPGNCVHRTSSGSGGPIARGRQNKVIYLCGFQSGFKIAVSLVGGSFPVPRHLSPPPGPGRLTPGRQHNPCSPPPHTCALAAQSNSAASGRASEGSVAFCSDVSFRHMCSLHTEFKVKYSNYLKKLF